MAHDACSLQQQNVCKDGFKLAYVLGIPINLKSELQQTLSSCRCSELNFTEHVEWTLQEMKIEQNSRAPSSRNEFSR